MVESMEKYAPLPALSDLIEPSKESEELTACPRIMVVIGDSESEGGAQLMLLLSMASVTPPESPTARLATTWPLKTTVDTVIK